MVIGVVGVAMVVADDLDTGHTSPLLMLFAFGLFGERIGHLAVAGRLSAPWP